MELSEQNLKRMRDVRVYAVLVVLVLVGAACLLGGRGTNESKMCLSRILYLQYRMANGHSHQPSEDWKKEIEDSGVLKGYTCPEAAGGYGLEGIVGDDLNDFQSYKVRCKQHGTAAELRKQLGDSSYERVLKIVQASPTVKRGKGLGDDNNE